MFTVSEGSADMEASYNGATPGISYVVRGHTPFANIHLSRNSRPVVSGELLRSRTQASAIRITGTVLVSGDPKATAADVNANLSFRFVQLFMLMEKQAAYAGPTPSDGYMTMDFAGSRSFRGYKKFLIDSDPDDPGQIPYADNWQGVEKVDAVPGLWRAKVVLDDHPHTDIPLRLPNPQAGNRSNYLYAVNYWYYVITTLVAVDRKSGAIRPLMHLTWRAMCSARLPWTLEGGDPVVGAPQFSVRYFIVDDPIKGPPTGRGLHEMILSSGTTQPRDTQNAAAKDAYGAVLLSTAGNSEYQVSAKWPQTSPLTVPSSHFQR